ncbi:MAG: hypothetical protein Tsb002_03430 [Wenzhouxiangellaceae bacterium]
MPITESPAVYPYLAVGVVEIFYQGQEGVVRAIGSGYLFSTPQYPGRRFILGAGHNLRHMGAGFNQLLFTFYRQRDIYTVAERDDGTPRYAIAGSALPNDYGVFVLAEDAPSGLQPLSLATVQPGPPLNAIAAGGLAAQVREGNRAIYMSSATFNSEALGLLAAPVGTTAPGMSGGPILRQTSSAWSAYGVIHGEGTINQQPYDLAVAFSDATLQQINLLIAAALSG